VFAPVASDAKLRAELAGSNIVEPLLLTCATEEFAAHTGNVNCVKIGRKSSGVLVTGGDDKKVNLWTVGHQSRTMASGAESSKLCKPEHCPLQELRWQKCGHLCEVADANQGCKLCMQSLAGHQTPVESVTFDVNEEVVAAGAASGSIKLFDLEQAGKGEIPESAVLSFYNATHSHSIGIGFCCCSDTCSDRSPFQCQVP
jgi:WD40 repeat protein